ncbi:MAG: hypothetical protein WBG30_08035 [Psychrilyobacter sp.]|uniref:hypothetical protein n=1 Tax=Psychrilyobacter sp. TaxID=2586924 RepID=UPI003C708A73
MKLSFEKYIETENLTKESLELYKEGIVCYKAGAYRASLIMTYLAFLESIKNKVMIAEKPTGVIDSVWGKIRNKIQKEDEWDKNTFEVLTQEDLQIKNGTETIKKKIFTLSGSLKRELEYWRDRRNDCAHYKKNQITSSHIESFWSFINSNYKKINMYGSRDALLKKLDDYINLNIKISDQRIKDILKKISQEIKNESEAEEVILAIELLMKGDDNPWFLYEDKMEDILCYLVDLGNENMIKGIEKHLNSKGSIVSFLEKDIQNLIKLKISDSLILKLWKQELDKIQKNELCALVSLLLTNDLVIENDKEEFKKEVANYLIHTSLSEFEFKILEDNGILEVFLNSKVYGCYDFNRWNWHNSFIFYLLEKTKSLELLKEIMKVTKHTYSPNRTVETLGEKLENEDWKRDMRKLYENTGEEPDSLLAESVTE